MKIGDIVKTPKYGNGTVVDEETCQKSGFEKELIPTGRFGVKLDNPDLWPCSKLSNCNGIAYFYPSEVEIV